MSTNRFDDYNVWLEAIIRTCKQSGNWEVIDDWAYSTNGHYGTDLKLYHLCSGSHIRYLDDPNHQVSQATPMDDKNCV